MTDSQFNRRLIIDGVAMCYSSIFWGESGELAVHQSFHYTSSKAETEIYRLYPDHVSFPPFSYPSASMVKGSSRRFRVGRSLKHVSSRITSELIEHNRRAAHLWLHADGTQAATLLVQWGLTIWDGGCAACVQGH
jgi:hypothetical protein